MHRVSGQPVTRVVVVYLVACVVGFFAFTIVASSSVPGTPWDASTPLTWGLFLAEPPPDAVNRIEAAAIHMTIGWHAGYSVTSSGGSWTGHVRSVTITNTMEPSLSWVVPGKADAWVLRHEQGHFDLNEVYRRKLELLLPCTQARTATKQGTIDALNAALHRRAEQVLLQLQAAQARYDAETDHGNDPAARVRWEARIAAWLLNPTAAP